MNYAGRVGLAPSLRIGLVVGTPPPTPSEMGDDAAAARSVTPRTESAGSVARPPRPLDDFTVRQGLHAHRALPPQPRYMWPSTDLCRRRRCAGAPHDMRGRASAVVIVVVDVLHSPTGPRERQ